MSADPPPPTFVESRLDQYDSPSDRYAKEKITKLRSFLPRGGWNITPEERKNRSHRIHVLLLERCIRIKDYSQRLRQAFDHVLHGTEREPMTRSTENTALLREWETQFFNRIEIKDSIGWNYLFEHNFDTILRQVTRCFDDRHDMISTTLGRNPHISFWYTVETIWKGIGYEPSRLYSAMTREMRSKRDFIGGRLRTPSSARAGLIWAKMDAIKEKAAQSLNSKEIQFIESWTNKVTQALLHRCQLKPRLLNNLEAWIMIEDGSDWIAEDPQRASEPYAGFPGGRYQILSREMIVQILDEMLEDYEMPPAYWNLTSLAHYRRIGIRQAKLRQDLQTFGPAPGGGLYI